MNPEARGNRINDQLSFEDFIKFLHQAVVLQQNLHAKTEGNYDYYRDQLPIFQLFQGDMVQWRPPEGQQISIPEEVGEMYQIEQAEYHNEYHWIYPFLTRGEAITSAEYLKADTDGVYAHSGRRRVVLFSPIDPFHKDPQILTRLSLVEEPRI